MKGVLDAIDRWWCHEAPAARLGVLRVLVGGFALIYVLVRIVHLTRYTSFRASQFKPIGISTLLEQPMPAWAVYAGVIATVFAGVAYFLGWRFKITGPVFAALLIWVITYRNSWGMVFHTENLMVVHVAILALAPSADAVSLDARRKGDRPPPGQRYGWAITLMCVITTLTYLLAGIAKMENSGLVWITEDVLRNYIAYDNLRKLALGDIYSPLGAWLVRYDWFWPPLAALSIALEIGAPLALFHKKVGRVWAVLVWGFHMGVVVLMAIVFPYNIAFIAFASFFDTEKMLEWKIVRRFTDKKPSPTDDAESSTAPA